MRANDASMRLRKKVVLLDSDPVAELDVQARSVYVRLDCVGGSSPTSVFGIGSVQQTKPTDRKSVV